MQLHPTFPEQRDILSTITDPSVLALLRKYPQLKKIIGPELSDIMTRAKEMSVPAHTIIMREKERCGHFVFVLEGRVRIFQHAEDGREVTLYHANPTDVCVMSLGSLLHSKPFKANAESVDKVELLTFDSDDFFAALALSERFRTWVMTSLTDSFCDVLSTFHDTVFHRLEMRMACLLGQLFERAQSDTLEVTHQEIAQELGSSREVVSRILKHLEKQGCVILSRGQIRVGPTQKLPG